MSAALIVRDDSKLAIFFTDSAWALKQSSLERAALIGKVDNAETQEQAVSAQRELATLLSLVEKARKEVKEPVLTFGRQIDGAAAQFVQEAKEEQMRLALLVAGFQELEQARVRAAQQAENERLTKLERERAAELAKAKNIEAVDQIQAKFNEQARVEAPPLESVTPTRAQGQRIREEWDITVVNEWTLARAHPNCVKLVPLMSEIKDLLDTGVKVAGVTAKKQIKASVTAGRSLKAIDV